MDKKVCILYTGGTIGMVPTDRGYAPKKGYFQSLLDEIVQLRYEDMPQWDLVEFDSLLDSSDVAVDEWNSIVRPYRQDTMITMASWFSTVRTPWPTRRLPFHLCWRVWTSR